MMMATKGIACCPHVGITLICNSLILSVVTVRVQSRVERVHGCASNYFTHPEDPLDTCSELLADVLVVCHDGAIDFCHER